MAERFGQVLVEEFVAGEEHRFAVVDGKVVAITRRVPPHVIGDGAGKIESLLERKNVERRSRGNPLHRRPIAVDAAVVATLEGQGFDLSSVPEDGEVAWLRRTSNVSLGGEAIDQTDAYPKQYSSVAEGAVGAIPGLRMAGVDLMLPTTEGSENHYSATVIEINSSPMLSMHVFPWQGEPRPVYEHVLDAMFPSTAGSP